MNGNENAQNHKSLGKAGNPFPSLLPKPAGGGIVPTIHSGGEEEISYTAVKRECQGRLKQAACSPRRLGHTKEESHASFVPPQRNLPQLRGKKPVAQR